MTVYVLEIGSYSQRGVVGVYATAKQAMAAAGASWTHSPAGRGPEYWSTNEGDGAEVTPFELQGSVDQSGVRFRDIRRAGVP